MNKRRAGRHNTNAAGSAEPAGPAEPAASAEPEIMLDQETLADISSGVERDSRRVRDCVHRVQSKVPPADSAASTKDV